MGTNIIFDNKKFLILFVISLTIFLMPLARTEAFVLQDEYTEENKPGLVLGVWHGLLAPYSLVARFVNDDIEMYATQNSGWFYDAGFLIGTAGSVPFGWVAAIVSTIAHISP